jgi:hypothetical protein
MADLGITSYEEFDFISPPGREGLIAAIETLKLLDALEDDLSLSKTGKMMTSFPLLPRQSRIIVEAILRFPGVIEETIIAAAFLSTQSPYVLPPGEELDARKAHHGFRDSQGDFVSYLKLYRAYQDAPDKAKFCRRSYLDEKAMAEIANVCVQLEETVSAMGVPMGGGGPVEQYLSCIAKGLIQFVCVREEPKSREGRNFSGAGRSMYRSLTADRILIHPGSVLFKSDPPFIVAGEIVRTTRMYAMSVSPLSREALQAISPELFELVKHRSQSGGEGKVKKARDFTNSIRIGSGVFEIETVKGKKLVRLPWEKLAPLKKELAGISSGSFYKGLRGVITLEDKYTILGGEKLSLILTLLPSLELEGAPDRNWPRKKNFNSSLELPFLIEALPLILVPALWKRKSRELGFISLFTGGEGNYWFRCSRGFHTALNESLASVESLIDELGEETGLEVKHQVNQTYRRLSDYLG